MVKNYCKEQGNGRGSYSVLTLPIPFYKKFASKFLENKLMKNVKLASNASFYGAHHYDLVI